MIDILFTHSYFLQLDQKQLELSQPYPPLGTLYAAALARKEGYVVEFHDVSFLKNPDEIQGAFQKFKPRILVIYDDGFNYLTKMCLTNMREAAFRMLSLAAAEGVKTIVCSSDSTDQFESYLNNHADYIVLGEGETTMVEVIREIQNGEKGRVNIEGIAFRENGETVITGKKPVMKDLDQLPMPAWDLLDISPYRIAWEKWGRFSLNLATTRGCPYKCNWCAKPIWGQRYNSHSPERMVSEIIFLKEKFGMEHIWFCDDIFGLKPGWIKEFSAELKKKGIRIPFKIQSRADLLVNEETVSALAEAGCETVWMGAESGSQKILDAMDKGITLDEIYKARKLLSEYKIDTAFFLQFGYLGETRDDIEATLKMLHELMPEDIGVSISYPLPGTKFYETVKESMGRKVNWKDSDDLALMFRNLHSPEFYKRLHRYVHKKFRKWQAFQSIKGLIRKPFSSRRGEFKKALSFAWYLPASWVEFARMKKLENS